MIKTAMKRSFSCVVILYFVFLFLFGLGDFLFPDFVGKAENSTLSDKLCFSLEKIEARQSSADSRTASVEPMRLVAFGFLPIKTVDVRTYQPQEVTVGGELFGTRLSLGGLFVEKILNVETANGVRSPAKEAGICAGDLIVKADGVAVSDTASLVKILAKTTGEVHLSLMRGGKEKSAILHCVRDKTDGALKAGLYLRDGAAGIGTVTFQDPVSGKFAGLGHAICDASSAVPFPLQEGRLYDVSLEKVVRSEAKLPGEIRGKLERTETGTLEKNTACGVIGSFDHMPPDQSRTVLPLAPKEEVKTGKASVLCTLDNSGKKEYEIEIEEIIDKDRNTKNFIIHVTDPALIEKSGGIVQGMSGSPILQNGKLVGAVTHVLMGDATRGYGIYAETMFHEMNQP